MRNTWLFFGAVALFCLTLVTASTGPQPLYAQNGSNDRSGPRSGVMTPPPDINVSGIATVTVTPDRARIMLAVNTEATTAAAAGQENARISTAVQQAIRGTGLGIAAKDISSTGYSVSPKQEWNQNTQRSRITGYQVANTVVVIVPDPTQVGKVIDASLTAGANQVAGLEFFLLSTESARRQGLSSAMRTAREDADVLAKAAGGRLGDLMTASTQEEAPQWPQPMMARGEMAMSAEAAPSTPVSPGEQKLRITVQTRWRFIP